MLSSIPFIRTPLRPLSAAALAACTLMLASCGGGSDKKTLYVDFSYPTAYAYLWQSVTINFNATGLEGRDPYCSAIAGTFPAGMNLAAPGCFVLATTSEVATTSVTIRLTVPGLDGQVDKSFSFESVGPSTNYITFASAAVGEKISYKPVNAGFLSAGAPTWAPKIGETLVYSVSSGKLPLGLTLNAATGEIAGTIGAGAVTSNFVVSAVATSSGRTYSVNSGTRTFTVR